VGHAHIDRKNRRRLVRALEVCLLTKRPHSSFREQWKNPSIEAVGVILTRPRMELHERINRRTEAMFAAGVEEEVRQISGLGPTASQMLGLREIRALLDGKLPREDCIAAIQTATRRYAKRQMTWFRREPHLREIDLNSQINPASMIASLAQRARDAA
jgi:tRNA dimethylallyltransferase